MSGSLNSPIAVTVDGAETLGAVTSSCVRRCASSGALHMTRSAQTTRAERAEEDTD
jgi:hypothetical protein